jgi:hypothetical protein
VFAWTEDVNERESGLTVEITSAHNIDQQGQPDHCHDQRDESWIGMVERLCASLQMGGVSKP